MTLQPFSLPTPETRFFQAGSLIYKFKIRSGNSFSEDEVLEGDSFNQEMEEIVRTVLGVLDCLQPFSTPHYTVFPYKKRWGKVCKHHEDKRFYPYVIILYLEKNMLKGRKAQKKKIMRHVPIMSEPRPKRRRSDSPLEEAVIKELIKDVKAERHIPVTGAVDLGHQHAVKDAAKDSEPTEEAEMAQHTEKKKRMPDKPGILKRLVRNIFSFILKTPEND